MSQASDLLPGANDLPVRGDVPGDERDKADGDQRGR